MDLETILISGVVGAITSAITAYFTSKLKVSEEREKWSRDLSQKYAEVLQTDPNIAKNLAKQFGIALLVSRKTLTTAETGHGKYFLLPNSRIIVGRSPDCEIFLDDPVISGRQAAFSADRTNVFVESMGGTNPILVNGNVVQGRVRLRNGDEVLIGATNFEVILLN
jgi:pSer/pThr/pTyr-binding forkhead associated (FHA) protein